MKNLSHREIRTQDELEFAIFCIESIASKLKVNAECVYVALTEKSDILHSYIIPEYNILHTQGKEYIVNDILDVLCEQGISI